jgi:hypothetical protein
MAYLGGGGYSGKATERGTIGRLDHDPASSSGGVWGSWMEVLSGWKGSARWPHFHYQVGRAAGVKDAYAHDEPMALEHRVLCMGFRCTFAVQAVFKWLKALSLSSEGEHTEGEHNVSSSGINTSPRQTSLP